MKKVVQAGPEFVIEEVENLDADAQALLMPSIAEGARTVIAGKDLPLEETIANMSQILAGLVRNDHGATGNKIPGLGDIPGLGRLFGSNKDNMSKSELVLAITPRIVRNLPYQSPSDMEFPTGTETSLQIRNLERASELAEPGPDAPLGDTPIAGRP